MSENDSEVNYCIRQNEVHHSLKFSAVPQVQSNHMECMREAEGTVVLHMGTKEARSRREVGRIQNPPSPD